MKILTMLRIVLGFGLLALFTTLASALAAWAIEPGDEGAVRLHIVLALAAALLVSAAHLFFAVFLPRAAVALNGEGESLPGWLPTALLAAAAIALTLAAVVVGVQSMSQSFRDAPHRWLAYAALVAQVAALLVEGRSAREIGVAEARDASD